MAIVFDGKAYSLKKKILLTSGVKLLKEKGKYLKMATILVGEDSASKIYVNLKKKYIEDIGAELDIYNLPEKTSASEVKTLIESLNEDESVLGVMVQLPLPEPLNNFKSEILNAINSEKDIDGLKQDSKFIPPTVKAVLEILSLAINETGKEVRSICVVGATGMVGKPLVKELRSSSAIKKVGHGVIEVDESTKNLEEKTRQADVLISATGVINLINSEMVKLDAIVIDVGSPFGDIDPRVEENVSFFTPVPGGVGPVTISCLAENLLQTV